MLPHSLDLTEIIRVHRSVQDAERTAAGDRWVDTWMLFTTKIETPI
jgi:hypothetical protein